MTLVAVSTLGAALAVGASSFQLEAGARGWFFEGHGEVLETDIGAIGFEDPRGQPEVFADLSVGRHRFRVDALLVRRTEEATVEANVLDILVLETDASVEIDAEIYRAHYGYELVQGTFGTLEPFLEVAVLDERAEVRNETLGLSDTSDETVVFPLPGVRATLGRDLPFALEGRISGMGYSGDHLIDAEGGVKSERGPVFIGIGYRWIDLAIDRGGGQSDDADLELRGVYVQGGVRF